MGWALLLSAALAGDRDDDGVRNKVDACPKEAEDLDGYQDDDGCPEPTDVQVKVKDTDGYFYPNAAWTLGDHSGVSGTQLDLPAGDHTFWVEGFPTTVEVPEGAPDIVYLVIPAPRGLFAVQAVDIFGNMVAADFVAKGPQRTRHPCNKDVMMRPGTWMVRVTAPGFDPVVGRVYVREDETVRVEALMLETAEDRDGDGRPDDVDQCPDYEEDMDGDRDEDGCPDLQEVTEK